MTGVAGTGGAPAESTGHALDVERLREEFPLLARPGPSGTSLTYLDNASTTPKPRRVLAAIREYYECYTANVSRGVHALASEATAAFEAVRHAAASHIGASSAEIVFTRGTTEGLNIIASSLGLSPDDEVILTKAEHHSNLLPWQARARPVFLPSSDDGVPRWDLLPDLISPRTRLIAVHHVSNVLGTIAPLSEIASLAGERGILLVVDGAQAAGHLSVDVRRIGCDFYSFSGHKMGGPTGVGVLYARSPWLEKLNPYQWGGGMVAKVEEGSLELRGGPQRFEAGTPNVEGVLGLGAALGLLRELGMDRVENHGRDLSRVLMDGCRSIPGVRILGGDRPSGTRIPLVALEVEVLDAETLSRTLSDGLGIMLSAGQHCAHRLHRQLNLGATLRASAWMINTTGEIEHFVSALRTLLG